MLQLETEKKTTTETRKKTFFFIFSISLKSTIDSFIHTLIVLSTLIFI